MGRPRFTQPASAALLAVLISAVALVCAAQEAPAGPTPVEDGSLPTAEPHTARTVCNPATLNSTRPIPCTEDQEADALADLAADTPSAADAAAAVFDTSTCDPADAGNYTEAVELFEADLLAVVYDVAHEFVLAQPNDSFWALNCTGDYTQDPFNACRVPAEANAPQQEDVVVTEFKVQFKLSCSVGLNDTVALEATAALVSSPDGNQTVSGIQWTQIPLPGVGQ